MTTKDYADALRRLNQDTDGNIMIPLKPVELAVMIFSSNLPNEEKLSQLKALAPYIEDDQKAIKKIIKGIKAMIKLEEKILPVASNVNTLLEIGSLNQFVADFNGARIENYSYSNNTCPDFNDNDFFCCNNENDDLYSFDNDEDEDSTENEDYFIIDDEEEAFELDAEDEDEWFGFDDEDTEDGEYEDTDDEDDEDSLPDSQNPFMVFKL